jgi:hypothetical protein
MRVEGRFVKGELFEKLAELVKSRKNDFAMAEILGLKMD